MWTNELDGRATLGTRRGGEGGGHLTAGPSSQRRGYMSRDGWEGVFVPRKHDIRLASICAPITKHTERQIFGFPLKLPRKRVLLR